MPPPSTSTRVMVMRDPVDEGLHGGGHQAQAGSLMLWLVDEVKQLAAVVAAHDAGIHRGDEDIAHRLDVVGGADGAAGGCIHAEPVHCGPPEVPCRC